MELGYRPRHPLATSFLNALIVILFVLACAPSFGQERQLCNVVAQVLTDFAELRPAEAVRGRRLPQGFTCADNYSFEIEPDRCIVRGGVIGDSRSGPGTWVVEFAWLNPSEEAATVRMRAALSSLRVCRALNPSVSDRAFIGAEVVSVSQGQHSGADVSFDTANAVGKSAADRYWTFIAVHGRQED